MNSFCPQSFRQHFPLLNFFSIVEKKNKNSCVYFDNAATTQKPNQVIDCLQHYYSTLNANVHRSSHQLSTQSTQAFETSRALVQQFINASSTKEIIWTKGATESINLVAQSLGRELLQADDEILLSQAEHHANIVPWQIVAQQTRAIIKILPLTPEGTIDCSVLDKYINKKTKIVACNHISNVIGKINPIEKIIAKAKEVGAVTLIDGAQAVAHLPINVQQLGCDFYVFSAHKMFGPTGLGVLYGREELLKQMSPYQTGGEMIKKVSFTTATTFNELPYKFEAGTPNIAGVVAFGQAISFLKKYDHQALKNYESFLIDYCFKALQQIPNVAFIVQKKPDIPIISFTVNGFHNYDIATALDSYNIAIRSGHHCTMPLMAYLTLNGCLRMSLAPYNTVEEIDYFIDILKKIINDEKMIFVHESEPKLDIEQAQLIINDFAKVKSWDARHREIMLLSKKLDRLTPMSRNDQTLITGCESSAWLIAEKDSQGVFSFKADSDAKVIRGLLVIILAAYNHKNAEKINSFDINHYFETLGLIQHLSPSRGNGARAIVDKIKDAVSKHL